MPWSLSDSSVWGMKQGGSVVLVWANKLSVRLTLYAHAHAQSNRERERRVSGLAKRPTHCLKQKLRFSGRPNPVIRRLNVVMVVLKVVTIFL